MQRHRKFVGGVRIKVVTIFDAVGGEPTFQRLVDAFYAGVENDPVLRPLYPEDLTGPRRHLMLFLIQYFGGPSTYSDERGHPALRMRHQPFAIGQIERDAWLRHMSAAIDTLDLPELAKIQIRSYFEGASTFLINRPKWEPGNLPYTVVRKSLRAKPH